MKILESIYLVLGMLSAHLADPPELEPTHPILNSRLMFLAWQPYTSTAPRYCLSSHRPGSGLGPKGWGGMGYPSSFPLFPHHSQGLPFLVSQPQRQ